MRKLAKIVGTALWVAALALPVYAEGQDATEAPAEAPEASRVPEPAQRALRHLWVEYAPLVEAELLRAFRSVPPEWGPQVDAYRTLATSPEGRRLGAGMVLALFLLWAVLRIARRPGDLVVCMEYPAELRGTFRVQVAYRKKALVRTPRHAREDRHRKVSSRLEHHMIARETSFRGLVPGKCWVSVEGMLQDPEGDQVVREAFEVQSVPLRSRHTARLEFDFRPKGCMLTVRVLWGGKPAQDAAVALFGTPGTQRYTRGGAARIDLPLGQHRIVAGGGDRVAEREIEILSYQSTSLEIDLASEDVVFKGCPPAVAPYLQGDLGVAARALEHEGEDALSHQLQARLHEQNGRPERAVELYQRAGDQQSAIRLLLAVESDHPGYSDACEMLADAYEREDQPELAVDKIEEAIAAAGTDPRVPELQSRLASLLERCDDLPRALEVLQKIHDEDPDYPSVATRIEAVRKRLSGDPGTITLPRGSASPSEERRYQVLEQVGAGGMGVVYRALDRRLNREVALKQLPENLRNHPTAVQLFLREAQAAAAMNHPNIVTLYDADEEDGTFFLTMELLEGTSLSALLRRHGRIEPRDVMLMGRQIAAGLQYAHERRIVHRDIKPANLFYTNERIVKIMDFGLAKMIEEVRRATTVLGGTPYYMAPEQSSGEPVGTGADLYALGVTLFELVTGAVPFKEGDVAHHHRHTPAPNPGTLVESIPNALCEIILRLLAKHAPERPDAVELGETLEALSRTMPA